MAAKSNPSKTSTELERENLAARLKEAREYLGLSQEYVAQQTDIPRPAISEIEAGRRRVESLELQRLAELYSRPINYFLRCADSPAPEARGQMDVEAKLRNTTKDLPVDDVEEVLRFAEYLRHKKIAAEARPAAGRK
ncbi:MAG: helix-turn-helix domain-containing protein [Bryobacteraceae bacterium]